MQQDLLPLASSGGACKCEVQQGIGRERPLAPTGLTVAAIPQERTIAGLSATIEAAGLAVGVWAETAVQGPCKTGIGRDQRRLRLPFSLHLQSQLGM